ncbi:PREDICTED: uncharacterized protein LOC104605605 [Nelumbo nucifera]|uniref:Uncharacterized protein LOC104605605 n=1 Tax=Nelumbo nucifera TaxID=4432 RepID=A0A1U8AR04_NELNU|nr:PREDICTED: uncharacterized protein LOC104605605 [Nelumbo nucifera]
MDKALIELLVDQVALGNKIDKGFRTFAYTSVCKEMTARFNIDMRTPHTKKRMRTLKPIYMEAKKLLETSGFGWNETKNQIIADLVVSDDYIKMFEEMQTIMENDQPIGDKAMVGFESMTECNVDFDGAEEDDLEINDDAITPLTVDEFICEDGTQSVSNNNRMAEIEMDFLNCLWKEVMDLERYDIQVRSTIFRYLGEHDKEARIFLARDKPFRAQMVLSIISKMIGFGGM